MRRWQEVLNEQSDHFSGDTLLSRLEELKKITTLVGRGRGRTWRGKGKEREGDGRGGAHEGGRRWRGMERRGSGGEGGGGEMGVGCSIDIGSSLALAQVENWTDVSVQIFSRHEEGDAIHKQEGEAPIHKQEVEGSTHKQEGEPPTHSREQEMMLSLNARIRSCLSHYITRLSGENGG